MIDSRHTASFESMHHRTTVHTLGYFCISLSLAGLATACVGEPGLEGFEDFEEDVIEVEGIDAAGVGEVGPAALSTDASEFEFVGAPVSERAPAPRLAEGEAWLRGSLAAGERLQDVRLVELPASGGSYFEAVALGSDAAHVLHVDLAGRPIDAEAREAEEVRAHHRRYGKLSRALHGELDGGEEVLPVRFELHVPLLPLELPRAEDPEDIGAFEDAITRGRAEHRAQIAVYAAPLLAWLEAQGVRDARIDAGMPAISASVPAALLRRAALHEAEGINRVDLREGVAAEPPPLQGYAAHRSFGDEQADGGSCGGPCTGFNFFQVGVWERTTTPAGIADANTRFLLGPNDVTYQASPRVCSNDADCYSSWDGSLAGYKCVANTCRQEHSSWVTAMLGMSGSYSEGGVLYPTAGTPEVAQVYVGNDTNNALGWILDTGPVLYVNRSQSSLGNQFRDMDHAVRYEQAMITMAAGNGGDEGGEACGGGIGYNALCVGAYSYQNPASTLDDTRSYYSNYVNPAATGAERPHLLGPGNKANNVGLHVPSITSSGSSMTSVSQGYLASGSAIMGTSFAAPAVLSVAMQAHIYGGLFTSLYFPIVKKAVLMAGSRDANSDGWLLSSSISSTWSGQPDGEDGAGAPAINNIEAILDADDYRYIKLTDSKMQSCGDDCLEYEVATVTLPWFRHLRVAMAYNACVDNPFGSSSLANDFDLWVERPAGCGPNLGSVSTNDEVEMVYDTCVKGGDYTVKIRLKGDAIDMCGSETSEPVAVAWMD